MNNLELKAMRQSLGLTVTEAAELTQVSKRAFQYWESGKRLVPDDVDLYFFTLASNYTMVLEKMMADVQATTVQPSDEVVAPTKKPVLPFFHSFEDFNKTKKCKSVACWRIYQAVVGQLLLLGNITKLDDAAVIPKSFWVHKWLKSNLDKKA